MNRVTRLTSAAFGMLLLAGLAYYQGHEDPTAGEHGSLAGTAVSKKPEQRDVDCKKPGALDDQGREYCENKEHSGEAL